MSATHSPNETEESFAAKLCTEDGVKRIFLAGLFLSFFVRLLALLENRVGRQITRKV
jgi:hypothetical protein